MAATVGFFCSLEECPQTENSSPNEPSNSTKNQSQYSKAGRGRKMTRVRGGRAGRTGRNGAAKDTSDTQVTGLTEKVNQSSTSKSDVSEEDKSNEVNEDSSSEMVSEVRRSRRKRTPTKLLANELQEKPPRRVYKNRGTKKKREPGQPDVNQDGSPFCCDRCGSNYIVKPSRCKISKDNTAVPKKKRVFGIRYKIDPETKKRLTLCNACGIRFDRMQKNQHRYKAPIATEQDKVKYQEDAKRFASSLVEGLKDPDAHRLACLYISSKPCGCMQRYIIAEGNMEESRDRASNLLKMIKDAKKLKDKKSYNVEELLSKGKKFRKVGLGNGHKRSKEFEEFVLASRQYLRNSLKFCERACQRILSYSNNFLHKKLKTEPEKRERIQRTKGKMALGLLKDIVELPGIKCCEAECTMMASSHAVLLKTWRERANSGQAEARKVLAEMLTPTGKVCNCANFITLVTGCSLCTIQSVSEQMKVTGGVREPPAHGLKKYWQNNPRRQQSYSELMEPETLRQVTRDNTRQQVSKKSGTGGTSGSGDHRSRSPETETPVFTAAELRDKQVQLKRLQQQLDEQQRHIVHQQMVIEQQLQKHKLAAQQQKQLQKQRQQEQQQQQQQQQQREILQAQQTPSEQVSTQSAVRQQPGTQQATTTQQQMTQLAAQQQLLLQQLGAQQIAQQLAVQQQQVASTGTTVGVMQPPSGVEGNMMDGRQLQQNMQQLLQEIQNQINVQQNSMQQLLLEMQSEMTGQQLQQLQQLGISTTPSSTSAVIPTVTVTSSQPPPSYNAAVTLLNALNSGHVLSSASSMSTTHTLPQPIAGTRQTAPQPAPVIIQAIPGVQQNFLFSGAPLHSQILPGPAGDARPTPHPILVSLPPSLTTESITTSALSAPLSQENLNSDIVEIVELQQIPLSDSANQSTGNGLQQVNLTSELDAVTLARLSRVLNTQDLRPGMGASLPQLHARPTRTTTNSELPDSLTRNIPTDGQPSTSTSQLINIESLLPELQFAAPNGQGLPVLYKQNNNTDKAKH